MSRAWISDLGSDVPYEPTAALQRALRAARERDEIPDTLLVLEHQPVITTGHRTEAHEVAHALTTGVPVVPTDRGGKATYHGPGQIVVYPVFDLRAHGTDVRAFVRGIEQATILTLEDLGIAAERRCDYPGVWVGGRKIASLGLRVTRWISFHGVALNVDCDLAPFGWFTPCGIPDVQMTSVEHELGASPGIGAVRERFATALAREFRLQPLRVDAVLIERIAKEHAGGEHAGSGAPDRERRFVPCASSHDDTGREVTA